MSHRCLDLNWWCVGGNMLISIAKISPIFWSFSVLSCCSLPNKLWSNRWQDSKGQMHQPSIGNSDEIIESRRKLPQLQWRKGRRVWATQCSCQLWPVEFGPVVQTYGVSSEYPTKQRNDACASSRLCRFFSGSRGHCVQRWARKLRDLRNGYFWAGSTDPEHSNSKCPFCLGFLEDNQIMIIKWHRQVPAFGGWDMFRWAIRQQIL